MASLTLLNIEDLSWRNCAEGFVLGRSFRGFNYTKVKGPSHEMSAPSVVELNPRWVQGPQKKGAY
jgi:hypothetical protein